jgi:hypothetical protein
MQMEPLSLIALLARTLTPTLLFNLNPNLNLNLLL